MSKNITLFCCAGMSTSMLVNRMKAEAAKRGVDYNIAAYSLNELDSYGPDANVILLGPQVRYALPKVKAQFPDKPVDSIDMRSYGMMDGKTVLEFAEKKLNS